ncbi:hypothetical protein ABH15_04575 [Methanoculleus taiwanensis]|uniref:DNA repair protein n=1 Tax=Methanoculleus taiwanensis TaxID=1550565 RepID=A0A498H705_9EURY|nr:Nre family DNA repair protein [Methanoculleus taiwanensis]RXE57366.1 hypothetical protein ABH15_04575 [Methanoculleus taiwanensis]
MRCAECKGKKGLCGLERCPVISRFHAQLAVKPSDHYMGGAPSVFVGSYGYPNVSGGPLLINDPDTPPVWVDRGLSIDDIVGLRARTIRGTSEVARVVDNMQEIALSSSPLDVEVRFTKPVAVDVRFDGTVAPVGLSGAIRKMDIIDNARVERAVDKITSDTDLPAVDACNLLHESSIDVYRITELLTTGLLGKKRRIVPTRWAITAVDDMVSTGLKKSVTRYPSIEGYRLFDGTLYGNHIVCILAPGDWKYEMIEIWGRRSLWSGETETIAVDGEGQKKTGYSPLAGAYYSARLAVTEYLESIRRSARVIVLRSISSEYWAPLGTWVVREAARAAMKNPAGTYATLDEAVAAASRLLGNARWLPESRLVPELKTQKTLFDF